MARGRMISKSLSTSKKYAALYQEPLGEFCQALYPLIVAHADDFGRLEGNVFTIKHSLVPASPRTENEISAALQLLHDVRLIVWYEVSGERYLEVVDFERHQGGLHKRTSSRFPRIPGNSGKVRGIPHQLNRTELKGTELKGTQSSVADAPLAVITKIAHEAIEQLGTNHEDLPETVKSLCALRDIAYNSGVVRKAIDSAHSQRRRSAS